MTVQSYAWRELLLKLTELAKGDGHALSVEDVHNTYRATTTRFADRVRSQIKGEWRQFLPGSAYYVRVHTHGVTITRTA